MIFAVDLAARSSGWVLLDARQQPYVVKAHGVVAIKGEWGPLAWEETLRAWLDVLSKAADWGHAVGGALLDCIAYEVPGWAGQSGDSRSGHGTSYRTREMLIGADHLFGALAVGYTRRIMRLDQANVKEAIAGRRQATKLDVSTVLEMRRLSGEFGSDHEVDALAVALHAAALLKQEAMA